MGKESFGVESFDYKFWEKAHRTDYYLNWAEYGRTMKQPWLEDEVGLIEEKNTKSTLEIGCSTGYYCHSLNKQGFGKVKGIDISETAIAKASEAVSKQDLNNIGFEVHDILSTELPEDEYDLILDFSCSTHFFPDDLQSHFEKVAGALKKDGVFLLTFWSSNTDSVFSMATDKEKDNFIPFVNESGTMYNNYLTEKTMKSLLGPLFSSVEMKEVEISIQDLGCLRWWFVKGVK